MGPCEMRSHVRGNRGYLYSDVPCPEGRSRPTSLAGGNERGVYMVDSFHEHSNKKAPVIFVAFQICKSEVMWGYISVQPILIFLVTFQLPLKEISGRFLIPVILDICDG